MIKVLVVDDQNLSRKLIETYLKTENNIKVVGFAKNGAEAIERAKDLQPDVVLMDLEMPDIDGLAATKAIIKEFRAIKILILTAHDNEQHLSKALENGAKGYLLKTNNPQELKNAIYNAERGYFQLSAELTEKYLQRIVTVKGDSDRIYDLGKKVYELEKSLDSLKEQSNQFRNSLERNIRRKVTYVLQQEIAKTSDRDSHLQFKVDRMKYSQTRLENDNKRLLKIQIICLVITFIALVTAIVSYFR